ncbi:glutathione S-transferase [Shewanella submarina]|uniref:Glutathione S-transferase n=1 Tax=Shewanella submarina TaxID=2016376 RepID=A0ABV7GFB3_9GAMM|nr:glutathione S-transferase [Shewanella submarina]MCL1037608.1 glutathione S-transferase [Shewanella submarina]
MTNSLPLLYSFRRCPYAMRARLALLTCGIQVELREILLKNKPEHMLELSPKGTVPVMLLADGKVLEESQDILFYALNHMALEHLPASDDKLWLESHRSSTQSWLCACDQEFKPWLDKYKYADRFPEQAETWYREQACRFLTKLESGLTTQAYLDGDKPSLSDWGVMPFVRQFAGVDKNWWQTRPLPHLADWLQRLIDTHTFRQCMQKYPEYIETGETFEFPPCTSK